MAIIHRICNTLPHHLMRSTASRRRRVLASTSRYLPRTASQISTHINIFYQNYHSTHFNAASERVDRIFDKILQLDTVEVHLLTELINEKMGIRPMTAAQRAAMSNGGVGSKASSAAAEPVEEKKIFDVKLNGFDANGKIKVIKEIRTITGLGLKEAKELVEGVPKVIKKDIKMDEAEDIKAKLEAVGATIEIS